MAYTFYLHNTRDTMTPCLLGTVESAGLIFADDGFGNYISIDLALAVVAVRDAHNGN